MGFFFACKPQETYSLNDLEDETLDKNEDLGLRIYICGNLPQKKYFIDIFNKKISNKKYINSGEFEFKTIQIYWIARIYQELTEESISSIANEIESDCSKPKGEAIEQNVILYFGDDNYDKLIKEIKKKGDVCSSLFIIVSEKDKIDNFDYEKRKITHIILNNETKKRLNNIIISQLWEYDCYYNEKGNILCRYTPDNIFKNLYNNIPFNSINILLTGKSRAGKSTFINYLTNRLVALESSKKVSVSQKKNEYCFYANIKNYENIPIKFFDTPGIVPGKTQDCLNILNDLLVNRENNLDDQIHFILFFFMEGDSLEGFNEIFQLLNECQKPILFIINKSLDESDNGKSKDIKSTISFLKANNFMNLIDEVNIIPVNIVKTKKLDDYGVNDIFKRIYEIFNEKNDFSNKNKIFKNSVDDEINLLLKKYKYLTERPYESQTKENEHLDYAEKAEELKKKIDGVSDMFKQMDIDNIIKAGKKAINKCRNLIISLGDLSDTLNSIDDDIPAISFFQAYMVKEIGEILGFNWKEMNIQVKTYLEEMKDKFDNLEVSKYDDKKKIKNEKSKINQDDIIRELKEEYNRSEDNFITQLAIKFHEIRKNEIENSTKPQNKIDRMITDGICIECRNYLIKVLEDSKGIFYWKNYLNSCIKLNKNLELLKSKEDNWCKFEMKIINK